MNQMQTSDIVVTNLPVPPYKLWVYPNGVKANGPDYIAWMEEVEPVIAEVADQDALWDRLRRRQNWGLEIAANVPATRSLVRLMDPVIHAIERAGAVNSTWELVNVEAYRYIYVDKGRMRVTIHALYTDQAPEDQS